MKMKRPRIKNVPKNCPFCKNEIEPNYKEIDTLKAYISERGKILSHMRTGLCFKHQGRVTLSIKHARHMALLPFMPKPH